MPAPLLKKFALFDIPYQEYGTDPAGPDFYSFHDSEYEALAEIDKTHFNNPIIIPCLVPNPEAR